MSDGCVCSLPRRWPSNSSNFFVFPLRLVFFPSSPYGFVCLYSYPITFLFSVNYLPRLLDSLGLLSFLYLVLSCYSVSSSSSSTIYSESRFSFPSSSLSYSFFLSLSSFSLFLNIIFSLYVTPGFSFSPLSIPPLRFLLSSFSSSSLVI